MSKGMNKVILFGNVGSDPELRYTHGNTPVLNLSIATNEAYFDKNKVLRERTEWHRVVVWGSVAESLSKVVTKGMGLLIEGSIRTTSFERNGERRYVTEVCARDVRITDRKQRLDMPLDFSVQADDMSAAATQRAPSVPAPAAPAPINAPYAPARQPPHSRSMVEEANIF